MTKEPKYSITFVGGFGPSSLEVETDVACTALDKVMHPDGTVRVEFRADPFGTKAKPRFMLESFQFESLAEYVRSQTQIVAALDAALERDREEWNEGGEAGRSGVWDAVRVKRVELPRQDPDRVKDFEMLVAGGVTISNTVAAGADLPGTRSFFVVVLRADWDDEHQLRAAFRDGALIDLVHE